MRDSVEVEGAEVVLRFEHGEAFRVCLQHAVLDAVVHHLHEVSGADRTDVQESIRWRQRLEDGPVALDRIVLSACHQAVPDLQSPDAAARPRVDEGDTALAGALATSQRVPAVAVATADA